MALSLPAHLIALVRKLASVLRCRHYTHNVRELLTPDDLGRFYEAALTAGAILSGFNGTFISFRIQREASYYRQPVLDYESETGKDAYIGQSRFNCSLVLIILGTLCSTIFGIFMPLAALAHWIRFRGSPGLIFAGIIASAVFAAAYFFNELIHYRIIKLKWKDFIGDIKRWEYEWINLIAGMVIAILLFFLTYRSVGR